MKTVKVDDKRQVRLPNAKPGQLFAYENKGNGVLTLMPVKPVKPRPIKGRLIKRGKRLLGVTDTPIDIKAIKEMISQFP